MERPLVSIVIAAYNTPDYTRKTLKSIVEQVYRPIEVVVSDDHSSISLKPIVEEFACFEDDLFSIRYHWQQVNLGGSDNQTFCFDQAAGKYVVQMPHDDWFTDERFLAEAIEIMENSPECYLCVANSELENANGFKMVKLPKSIDAKDKWCILEGDAYINLLGMDRIGHQAWSGIVCNAPAARSLGVFHYPFPMTRSQGEALGIMPDEGFAFQFLLSSIGSVALTEKVVSVRGRPPTSFCESRGEEWARVVGQAMFVIHYSLYKAKLTGKYAAAVKKRARETIFHYPVDRMNWRILRHYHYAPDAIWLMSLSYAKGWKGHVRRYPAHYVSLLRHFFQAAERGELSSLVAKHKARGVRGVFATLLPSR